MDAGFRPSRQMYFSVHQDLDRARVVIAGELDALTAADCRPALERLCQEDLSLVEIDLADLRVIDGVGVRLLFGIYKRMRERSCDLVLQAVSGQPREIFRVARLDRLMIESDQEAAPPDGDEIPAVEFR